MMKLGMKHVLAGAVVGVAVLLPVVVTSPSHLNLAILVLMAAQLGVAWNLLGGYAERTFKLPNPFYVIP